MSIKLPNINLIIERILPIESRYDSETKSIETWIKEHRQFIKTNKQILKKKDELDDIHILIILFGNLLMRSIKGESGARLEKVLKKHLRTKSDLNTSVFNTILIEARYRWTNNGGQVMSDTVKYFEELNWNWLSYFKMAQDFHEDNFQQDKLLKIKNLKYKVRNLAISNFNENYIANDLHIVRVSTRLGLLNYGFDLLPEPALEMGNNPSNVKNYLFLHKLFLKLSKMTNSNYTLADIDKVFWHFGRTICNNKPKCYECPVKEVCLTGQNS